MTKIPQQKIIPVKIVLQEQGLDKDIVLILSHFSIPLEERGKLIQAIHEAIHLFRIRSAKHDKSQRD